MKKIVVHDLMQKNYSYQLSEPMGKSFDPLFKPQLTPKEMLQMGVFGGKYMTDCTKEFPKDWFDKAKLCHEKHNASLNYFKVNASQPLAVWRKKGWLSQEDPRGWFQWYCRYYMGRRIPQEDQRQIKRWLAIDILHRLKRIANLVICHAERYKDKLCFIGHMIPRFCNYLKEKVVIICGTSLILSHSN